MKGRLAVVELLLNAGQKDSQRSSTARVDALDQNSRTPLMLSAEAGHLAVVRRLLANGADVELKDRERETAMDKAKRKRRADVATELQSAIDERPARAAEALEWKGTIASATLEGFRKFAGKYPESQFSRDAIRRATVRLETGMSIGESEADRIQAGLREARQSLGPSLMGGESEMTYVLSAHITHGDASFMQLQKNQRGAVTGYRITKEPRFKIEYSLKSSGGVQILLDPTGTDYSRTGITSGPLPNDSRYYVSVT